MKIGIVKESKSPPDERVPFIPEQCGVILDDYHCEIFVQKSNVRRIKDHSYFQAGLNLVDDLSQCDVLFGVKEVPEDLLLPDKTYFFFSHTIKEQPYNRTLLKEVLNKHIRLIDYECLVDENDLRLLGFGHFAGLVGTYNGLRMIGLKQGIFQLKKAVECLDQEEMMDELSNVILPPMKICLTGKGRVAGGAVEILNSLNIKKVNVDDFLTEEFDEPVYVQLDVTDYAKRKDGSEGEMFDFFNNPDLYKSDFERFTKVTDFYIACHFWDARSPYFYTKADMSKPEFNIQYVADISCDIDGPIASTIRSSTIKEPFYGIDKSKGEEVDFMDEDSLSVMAVDNLPCELPVDASKDFGSQLMEVVLPGLFDGDSKNILKRATIAQNGKLMDRFSYLQSYVDGE